MTRSLRRPPAMRLCTARRILAVVLAAIPALAQRDGASPPPQGGGGDGPFADPLVLDLQRMVSDGSSMLLIMGSEADSPPPGPPPGGPGGGRGPPMQQPRVCDGFPALVTKSSTSNGACFGPNVTTTLSCSCLTDLAKMDKWEIRVTTPPAKTSDAPPPPPTLPPSAVLGISSILVFTLPSTLVSFSLVAETKEPLPIKVQSQPGPPGQSLSTWLVKVPLNNELKTLEIANFDFGKLQIKSGFLPTAVETLSLRQCKIKALPDTFLDEFTELKTLDVSMNALDGLYEDTGSSPARNRLSALNLSGNALTEFPSRLLAFKQLKSLDLTGNPFTDLTVTNATADALTSLSVFKLSAPSPNVTCTTGMWREIQDSRVCVPLASTSGKLVSPDEKGDSPNYIVYVVIAGSVVIVVVISLFMWKRISRSREPASNKDVLESLFQSTHDFDDTLPTVNASLVNDPIIITNRIPYNEIRVANCISKGGFGLVYSGVYNRRRVAIKKIRPDIAGDIKMIEAFLREICLMATLHHPHIVEFVGVSWDTLRNLCAVTEFMDRGDLREVLQSFKTRNTPLTWDHHKTMISLHIADALTYLHSLSPKVIHRDLKSKNVLLDSDMTAKLSDFGISRERNIEETHMTAGIGTSFWIAPEVLLGKDYDERADIFSFGVVLSEIDTDDYPYWNEKNPRAGGEQQQNAILQLVASGMLRPAFSDRCPPRILQLADKCLQVDPEDRPTAAEIVYELQRYISSLPPMSPGFST